MKIAFIAAGAADMYCGSCLRDNAAAGALMKLGHDVVFVPLYTPMRLDRDDVSLDRVFYGGINIYLLDKSRFFRRFRLFDGLLNYPPLLRLVSRFASMNRAEDLGRLAVSTLRGAEGPHRREIEKLGNWLADEIRPEIVNLPNSMFVPIADYLKRRTGAPVVCSLTGEDLFIVNMIEPYRSKAIGLLRARSGDVDGYIATSGYYAGHMAELLGVARERIRVVPLGVKTEGFGRKGPRPIDPFTVGYLARLAPEKGLHVLVDAFRLLKRMPGAENARLHVAGYLGPRDEPYLRDCVAKLKAWGLEKDYEYFGEVTFEEKVAFLDGLSALSVPTVYREPKGLFALEALAHGVPVVLPRHGAFPELIEATGGGRLCEPDDPLSLAEALCETMKRPEEADRMAREGQTAVRERFTDVRMAKATAEVYEGVLKLT